MEHVNQVWSADITYIRRGNGFAYLTAVIDWYSRRIFCEEAAREAIENFGWPDIFNWEGCLTRLSMDGKGRAYDNIFVERLWRTIKYEGVYLKDTTMSGNSLPLTGTLLQMYISRRFDLKKLPK